MAWFFLLDTSRETDFGLALAVTCVSGGVTVLALAAAGLGIGTAVLVFTTFALALTTVYARRLWLRDRTRRHRTRGDAVKVRRARGPAP